MRVSLLECCYFEIRDNILLFKNITSLEDGSFDGVSGPSESNRKSRKQRRNEIFAEQWGIDILDFHMNPSSSTASVPNIRKMQLD